MMFGMLRYLTLIVCLLIILLNLLFFRFWEMFDHGRKYFATSVNTLLFKNERLREKVVGVARSMPI